jgi:hypothetical protein
MVERKCMWPILRSITVGSRLQEPGQTIYEAGVLKIQPQHSVNTATYNIILYYDPSKMHIKIFTFIFYLGGMVSKTPKRIMAYFMKLS